MKTFIKKVWEWLAYSSTNAEQISLTFKGIATTLIPVILLVSQAYNLTLDNEYLETVITGIASLIITIGGFIGVFITTIGALRKIILTITKKNEVVAGWSQK